MQINVIKAIKPIDANSTLFGQAGETLKPIEPTESIAPLRLNVHTFHHPTQGSWQPI